MTPSAVLDAALARMEGLWVSLASDIPGNAGLLVDRSLRIRTVVGPLWGRTEAELASLRGKSLDQIAPPHIVAGIIHHFEAALKGQTRRFEIVSQSTYRCTVAPVLNDAGEIAGAICVGFSESQELHDERAAAAELAQRLSQQSAVARLGELALRRPDLDVLLDAACLAVTDGLGVDASYVLRPSGPNGLMRVSAGRGWSDGFVGSEFEMLSYADERRRDLYARPVVIEDLPNDEVWRARPLREHDVVSAATVQVGPSDSIAGLLGAYTFTPRAFTGRDLDFLTAVAHVLNGAMRSLEVERQIRHDALHDALTGLPNRTLLLERLTAALTTADAEGRHLALYFLDVDHLKVLNDSLGHHAGDELLRAVGPRLRSVLRPSDMIARFGGDEFAVLCGDIADEAQALRVAERLVRAFAQPFEVCGEPRFCSISVGVVVSDPAGTRGADELLSDADAALYRAKERGRGRHEVFDVGMRDRITTRLRIEDDLRRAMRNDELWVAYQPFVRLSDGEVAGVEALVRWTHPERGSIPPAEFIPIAEDSGLIVELGEYVLRTACAQVASWRADLRLTVNVSARQMALSGMPGTVGAVLRETGLPPERLGLEITEGLLLEETPATMETLQALQRLGVRLMLDDFGTGYSSLSYLRRYPLDVLKIDRSFVDDLGEDGLGDAAIVEAIVGMAKALGMRVIPEGVETAGQLARLTELGCDYAQGFHLSRPLAAPELEAWLKR